VQLRLTGKVLATDTVEDSFSGFPAAGILLVKLVLDMGSYILVLLELVHGFQASINCAFLVTTRHVTLDDLHCMRVQQVRSCQRLLPLFLLLGISHSLLCKSQSDPQKQTAKMTPAVCNAKTMRLFDLREQGGLGEDTELTLLREQGDLSTALRT